MASSRTRYIFNFKYRMHICYDKSGTPNYLVYNLWHATPVVVWSSFLIINFVVQENQGVRLIIKIIHFYPCHNHLCVSILHLCVHTPLVIICSQTLLSFFIYFSSCVILVDVLLSTYIISILVSWDSASKTHDIWFVLMVPYSYICC